MAKPPLSELIQHARGANERGAFDDARTFCAQIFHQDPGNVAGLSAYMVATKIAKNDKVFARIQKFATQTQLSDDLLSQLHFMLGKGFADLGQIQHAFDAIVRANQLKVASVDQAALQSSAKTLITRAEQAPRVQAPRSHLRPVFILGMPRSGTSLLAQALGGHPDIQNLGEQTALGAALSNPKTGQVDPHNFLKRLSQETVISARDRYLDAIRPLSQNASIVVDKMPENYWLAFAIPMLFPHALIVHMTRDRLATVWSCYRHDFLQGHAYSYDFEACLNQYEICKSLTSAWKTRDRAQWHGMALSRFSTNPQRELSVILRKLGLDWHDDCLSAGTQKNAVATLSKWQIRQDISPAISNQWEAFKPLIEQKWASVLK